jgi:hypothetical protein
MNQKIKNIDGYGGGPDTFTCSQATPYNPHGDYDKPIFHPEAYDLGEGKVYCPICLILFDEAVLNS